MTVAPQFRIPGQRAPAPAPSCPAYELLGARGSGEALAFMHLACAFICQRFPTRTVKR